MKLSVANSLDCKNKCIGSGDDSLHLLNYPNPSYAHDNMVLLESERNWLVLTHKALTLDVLQTRS